MNLPAMTTPLPPIEVEPISATRRGRYFGNWQEPVILLAILIVGLVLRLQHLTDTHSWFDESLGWRMAQFTPSEIIARSEQNVHPPLHFLLLHGWAIVFGGSLTALRCYSVLWGQLTVLGAYALARSATTTASQSTGNSFAALLAALFVAISPLHVNWSQQVKMYTLGTCLAVWSSWLLLTWFQSRSHWKLLLYIPLAASLALQHHYGVFTVFAQLTYALVWAAYRSFKSGGKQLVPVILAAWATASLWSLWLPSFLIQRNLVRETYWIRSFQWQSIADVWAQLFLFDSHSHLPLPIIWLVAEVVWVTIALLLFRREPGIRLLGWLVFVPYLIAVLWSSLLHNVLVARYLIYAQVFLLIGGAVVIGRIPSAWLRLSLTAVALAGACWTAEARWSERNRDAEMPGMPVAIQTLKDLRTRNEPLLVCNPMLYLNLLVHGPDLTSAYAFDPGHQFPHFQGTPVMKDSDYCNSEKLNQSGQSWVWTLDAEKWLGGSWKVKLPPEWKLQEQRPIHEWYAVLMLRLYRRELPTELKQE